MFVQGQKKEIADIKTVRFNNTSAITIPANDQNAVYVSTSTDITGYQLLGIVDYEIPNVANITVRRIQLDATPPFISIRNNSASSVTIDIGRAEIQGKYMKQG